MKITRNILLLFGAILLTNCERKEELQKTEIKKAVDEKITTPTEKLGIWEIAHTFEGELPNGKFTLTYKQHKTDTQELWSKSDISAIRVIGNISIIVENKTFDYPAYITRFPDKAGGMSLHGFWISYGSPNTIRIDVWESEPCWEIYRSQELAPADYQRGIITKQLSVHGDPTLQYPAESTSNR